MQFLCACVLPGSAEALVKWENYISFDCLHSQWNFCGKSSKSVRVGQSYSKPNVWSIL